MISEIKLACTRYGLLLALWVASVDVVALDVIAHRGFACGHIENTLGAIERAWEASADAVEVDVRVSSDGVAYLFHDDVIGTESTATLSFEAVQALTRFHVPTLNEALVKFVDKNFLVLDLKSVDTAALRSIAEAVRLASYPTDRLVIQSDSALALRDARRRLPGARFMFLSRLNYTIPFLLAPSADGVIKQARFARADGVSLKGRRFINQAYLETFSNAGLDIYVWTVNSAERQRYYRQFAIDGLITDRLQRLRNSVDGRNAAGEILCGAT